MTDRQPSPALLAALLLALPGSAAAAAVSHPCSVVDDPRQRLACFDAAFPRAVPAAPAAAPAAAPVAPVAPVAGTAPVPPVAATAPTTATAPTAATAAAAAAAVDPTTTFGLPAPRAPEPPPPEPDEPAEPSSIAGRVAAVGETRSRKLVVTLENGQVWVQTDTAGRAGLKPGVDVRIERAALGSYLLVTPDRRTIRVRRAQ